MTHHPQLNHCVPATPHVKSSFELDSYRYPVRPVSSAFSQNTTSHVRQKSSKVPPGQPWARPPAQSYPECRALFVENKPKPACVQHQAPTAHGHDYHQAHARAHQNEVHSQNNSYRDTFSVQNEYPQCQVYTQVLPAPSQSQIYGLRSPRHYTHHIEQVPVAQYPPFPHQQGWVEPHFDFHPLFDGQRCDRQPVKAQRFDNPMEANQFDTHVKPQCAAQQSQQCEYDEPAGYNVLANYKEPTDGDPVKTPVNYEQEEYSRKRPVPGLEQSCTQHDFVSCTPQSPQPYGTPVQPDPRYQEAFTRNSCIPHGPPASLPLAYLPQSAATQAAPAPAPALAPGTVQAKRDSRDVVCYTIVDHTGTAIPTLVDKDGHHLTLVDRRGSYLPTFSILHNGRAIRVTYGAQGNLLTPDDHGDLVPLDPDPFAQQRMVKSYQDDLKARSESKLAAWVNDIERRQRGPETRRRTDEYTTDNRMHAFHPMPQSVRDYAAPLPPPKKYCHSHSHSPASPSQAPRPTTLKCQPHVAGTFVPRLNPPVLPMPQPIVPSQAQAHERSPRASVTNTDDKAAPKKPALACQFCRKRKIACGPPPPSSLDKTCNQCTRRKQRCEYPTESRGIRKPPNVSVPTEDTTEPTVHKFVHGDANNLDNVVCSPDRRRGKRKHAIDDASPKLYAFVKR